MREIIFDTETTGFNARGDDRITEIGCIELIDLLPTGKEFHRYVNPQREVPEKVVELTGLTFDFLQDKPLFSEIAQDFLDFVGDDTLIAHNAAFDRGFINAELERAGFDILPHSRFKDTLAMAHAKLPGAPASLDALCKRFDISLTSRDKHGAIIDSQLLAAVYLELQGGRAMDLGFDNKDIAEKPISPDIKSDTTYQKRDVQNLSAKQIETHRAFIEGLGTDMIWQKLWRKESDNY